MSARRGGFALVAALWLLVALSAVSLDAALRSKTRRLPAVNALDDGRARQAALAGAEYARSRLTAAMRQYETELRSEMQRRGIRTNRMTISFGPEQNPWREPAQLMESAMTLGDLQFVIDVHDAGIALNLNTAPQAMLLQFLTQGMQLDYPAADRLTQAILDWRDQDTLPRANGAERAEYIDAGAVELPTNLRFASVDELRYVMGMTPELFAQVKPYLRVIGSGRINVNAAPEPVLAALPGLTAARAAQLVRLRNAGRIFTSASQLRQLLGMPTASQAEQQEFANRTVFTTTEVEIITEGRVENSPVRARATTIVRNATNRAVVVWQKVE